MTSISSTSAADIVVPSKAPQEADDTAAIFRQLRKVQQDCRNFGKHQAAIVLIGSCILEGIDTAPRIAGALQRLGVDSGLVFRTLKDCTGENPTYYHWRCDAKSRFTLLAGQEPL